MGLQVSIDNADMLDAIAASRKHYNSDKNPDQQFASDEDYAQAVVSMALKSQLGIRDEPDPNKTETLADQLQRQRESGVMVGANKRSDEKQAGEEVSGKPANPSSAAGTSGSSSGLSNQGALTSQPKAGDKK
jgi:hypothetical protein